MTIALSDLLIAFAAGALTFVSPCVLPIVPGYLGIIGAGRPDERPLAPVTAFVGSFGLVFVLLGAGAGLAGTALLAHRSVIERVGGILMIVAGIAMLGRSLPWLATRELRFHLPDRFRAAGRLPFAAAAGAVFAFGWSPCIGPTLGSILALAASRQSASQGVALLAVFSLGLGIPFAVVGIAGVGVLRHPRFRSSTRTIRIGSGVLMVGAGLLLMSGQLSAISGRLSSISFL